MKHIPLILMLVVLCGAALPATPAAAHGVIIEYKLAPIMALKIDLDATQTSGAALSGAEVTVFAPGESSIPWTTTETDKAGHVALMPDVQQTGIWIVQIAHDKQTALLRFPIQEGDIDLTKGIELETDSLTVTYHLTQIPAALVTITAAFDSGEAMSEGQVTVYTPDNAKTPWLTGLCDAEGRYAFIVDTTNLGTWEIQVRQAGHGDWVRIPVEADMVQLADSPADADSAGEAEKTPIITDVSGTSGGSSDFSPSQIVIMAVSVIWGLIGTALYFSSRKKPAARDHDEV
ncbi:MAG: hypothetical protein JXA10_19140 [Anaerolineae bacterium]|nr:hypothetical protein [Anaerolineae bacterium]